MGSPRVSVLLPAFNAATTIGAALRSVQRQRETKWECIVVDDGSTDGTLEIAARIARRDPRIRVFPLSHDGLVRALNTGLQHCTAAAIARMDADDCMHPDRLAQQLERLASERDLSGVGCGVRIFPRRTLSPNRTAYESWLNAIHAPGDVLRELYIECPLAHPTLTLRTDVFKAYQYRDQGWPEDYDLIFRLCAGGHRLASVSRPLLAWRDHPARLSRTSPAYAPEEFMRLRAHFLCENFLANHGSYVLWGYGPTARRLRKALGERGMWPRTIVDVHPRRIGQTIHGAMVIAPGQLSRNRHAPLIAAVSGLGPRTEIRTMLYRAGWDEGSDFVCAA